MKKVNNQLNIKNRELDGGFVLHYAINKSYIPDRKIWAAYGYFTTRRRAVFCRIQRSYGENIDSCID